MKTCAHCTTENRDGAIFCTHCRRPLQGSQGPGDDSSRNNTVWLLVLFLLIGLSAYVSSPNSFLRQSAVQSPTPISDAMLTALPAATRTLEPMTLQACVTDTTRIRRGPGTHYETTGGLLLGTCLTVLGRNDVASWVYIVSEDHQTGWVDVSLLNDAGGINRVSVRDDSRLSHARRATLTSAEIAYGAQAYLTKVSATNLPQAPVTRYVVPCFQTASRVGEHISCKMVRAVCDYLPALDGSPTYCNDRPHPDHSFALIVFGEDWSDYDGQCIIVSGYLEIDSGVLQIQALRRDQVSVCE